LLSCTVSLRLFVCVGVSAESRREGVRSNWTESIFDMVQVEEMEVKVKVKVKVEMKRVEQSRQISDSTDEGGTGSEGRRLSNQIGI
jgi:hypothetical protein